jgi:holo-[acyl-carrier protein] synthase
VNVLGLGLDLVAIDRVQRLLARHGERALARLLTESERLYCDRQAVPARHVAARLAAKEAAYKAFQQADGARRIGWRELEVVRGPDGRPALAMHGAALAAAAQLKVASTLLSISHTDTHAAAVVVLSGSNS